MPKIPSQPRVPTFPPKDCAEPSSIASGSESTHAIPPAESAEPLGIVPPPPDQDLEEILPRQIRCTETGIIVYGELPLEKWAKGFEFFQKIGSKTQWWRGDMLVYGERKYGESYAQAVDIHGKSESRLQTYVHVALKFPMERRRPELSFDHHAECASLEAREADALLLRAIRERWTKMDVRAETARIHERNGNPASRRGRKPGSTAAKVAASGKTPQVPDDEKPLIWEGNPLRVENVNGYRQIYAGNISLANDEADKAADHFKHAHGPALAAWLEEHGFQRKEGDEPCATTSPQQATRSIADAASAEVASNGASVVQPDAAPQIAQPAVPAAPPTPSKPVAATVTPKELLEALNIEILTLKAVIEQRTNEANLAAMMARQSCMERDDAREQLKRYDVHTDTQTPLERAEAAILAFNTASAEVNEEEWKTIGENKLLRTKWLNRLLAQADIVIDKIQGHTPAPRK